MLGFLHSLYTSLSQLHLNGLVPDITPAIFDLPPLPGASKAGDRMYRESANLLLKTPSGKVRNLPFMDWVDLIEPAVS